MKILLNRLVLVQFVHATVVLNHSTQSGSLHISYQVRMKSKNREHIIQQYNIQSFNKVM